MRARQSIGFTLLGVKTGKYNGRPKKGGLKVVIFLATLMFLHDVMGRCKVFLLG